MEGKKRGSMKPREASGTQPTSIVLADRPVPETGHISIVINVSARIAVSAEEARRKVNRFVHREISYLMRGDPPNLIVADRVYWRVPVVLTFPSYGSLGTVGSVDVDVESGELHVGPDYIAEVQRRAQELAARSSPQTAPAG